MLRNRSLTVPAWPAGPRIDGRVGKRGNHHEQAIPPGRLVVLPCPRRPGIVVGRSTDPAGPWCRMLADVFSAHESASPEPRPFPLTRAGSSGSRAFSRSKPAALSTQYAGHPLTGKNALKSPHAARAESGERPLPPRTASLAAQRMAAGVPWGGRPPGQTQPLPPALSAGMKIAVPASGPYFNKGSVLLNGA